MNREGGAICTEEAVYKTIPVAKFRHHILPAKWDLRPQLLPVRDQRNEPQCVSFSAVCVIEHMVYKLEKMRGRTGSSRMKRFSPEFIYSRRQNKPEDGMTVADALSILRQHGCVDEMWHPVGGVPMIPTDGLTAHAEKYRISGFAKVDTVEGLKSALVENGPCLIVVPLYNNSMQLWRCNAGDHLQGYQCMTVAGYDDVNEWFILRNTWGLLFGEAGYCYFPYSSWPLHRECWTVSIDNSFAENESPREGETEQPKGFKKTPCCVVC